jgi:cleavage and polyadenylation specificity factor subunit 3
MLGVRWELVRWHLEGMFGSVEEGLDKDGVPTMRVRVSLVVCLLFVVVEVWLLGCR